MKKKGLPGPKFKITSGIYLITCLPTNDGYVGKSTNLSQRWCQHRSDLKKGTHKNPHLQALYKAHGAANFEMVLLELVEDKNDLESREAYWIGIKQPTLNITDTKLSQNAVNQIKVLVASGVQEDEVANRYKITTKYLREILRGARWN